MEEVRDLKMIAKMYVFKGTFIIDFISVFPFKIIYGLKIDYLDFYIVLQLSTSACSNSIYFYVLLFTKVLVIGKWYPFIFQHHITMQSIVVVISQGQTIIQISTLFTFCMKGCFVTFFIV